MRKLLLILTISLITICASATNYVYCELVGTGKLFSNKVNVQVDYGQETSFWKGIDYIKDENGNKRQFNSMVDAMNFFGKQGWEFVQAYVITTQSRNVYHWLMKKAVTDEELNQAVESEKSANTTTPNNSNNNKDVPEALRKYMH